MLEKTKAWAKKKIDTIKKWTKENPAEAVCLVGGTIVGCVTGGYIGGAVGRRKGRVEGVNAGWSAAKDDSWQKHCELFDWDPNVSNGYRCTNSKPLHQKASDYISILQELDPEEKISGILVIDSTVEPMEKSDPDLPKIMC